MLLHELAKGLKNTKKSKRVGRGNSSGRGNYSGRGMKGQGQRSGGSMPSWFEGGQTSLSLRLPKKKGFKRYSRLVTNYQIVNIDTLNANDSVKDGTKINKELLLSLNLIKNKDGLVKILGKGMLEKKLIFKDIDMYSKSAILAIQSSGGEILMDEEKLSKLNETAENYKKIREEKMANLKAKKKQIEEKKIELEKKQSTLKKVETKSTTKAKKSSQKTTSKTAIDKKKPVKKTPTKSKDKVTTDSKKAKKAATNKTKTKVTKTSKKEEKSIENEKK